MPRHRDRIEIITSAGECKIASSVRLSQGMEEGAQLSLSCGDDRAWAAITRIFYPGQVAKLLLNGALQFTGRWEINHVPSDPHGGVTAELTARPRSADARYNTAVKGTGKTAHEDGDLSFQNISLKSYVLALFEPLGYSAADFQFDATADRDLVTGQKTGLPWLVDLEPLQQGRAKVQPGETVWDAFQRHIKRFHLLSWDGADGRIVVGRADDMAAPRYRLRAKRGSMSRANNILSATRTRDWSEAVSEVRIAGSTMGDDGDPRPLFGAAGDADVLAVANSTQHFRRRLLLPLEGQAVTQGLAEARARRELALRSKGKDAWELNVDGWSYWDGARSIPWAINATVDVDVDTIGAEGAGRYLIHKIQRTLDVHGSATTTLSIVAPGILAA